MKHIFTILVLLSIFSFKPDLTEAQELMHSYTFDNGTAEDAKGEADGTVYGGNLVNGMYETMEQGNYIALPADVIQLNTYSSNGFTLEAFIRSDANTNCTMFSFFGNTVGDYGVNYIYQRDNSCGSASTAISCLNTSAPWNAETSVQVNPLEDYAFHHIVTTYDNTNLAFYIDGVLKGKVSTSGTNNSIANISNQLAYLGKGGYLGDQTWMGAIDEFNIYSGVLSATTIAETANQYHSDATLANVTIDIATIENFDPETTSYSLTVPYGSTAAYVIAEPNSPNANVSGDGEVEISSPTHITVTSVNGEVQKIYTLNWLIQEAAADATLKDIQLNQGTLKPDFSPIETQYTVMLEKGTSEVSVSPIPTTNLAQVSGDGIIDVSSGSSTDTIKVVSGNGQDTTNYIIEFKVYNFNHPGIFHTRDDFHRMKRMVAAGVEPWASGYTQLVNSTYSNSSWTPRATETVIRGGTGDNVSLLYTDVARAYQCALRWKITGSTAHGNTAREMLNAWSSTMKYLSGNADRYLGSGLFGYQLANIAEMMRGYPEFDEAGMKDLLLNVFYYPLSERFLIGNAYGSDHNDACIDNYWANWDLQSGCHVCHWRLLR